MQTFKSDGVEIAYLDVASAAPLPGALPVLLIHGFASNTSTNWVATGWVRTLTDAGYRVIAFDNRGHGASQKLHALADYGAPLMAEDGRRLLDHLGIPQAHVVGYSMGARIAAFLVTLHPERVASVTFGGLGINMVRGMTGGGDTIAAGLEAATLDEITDPGARAFRIFAEQTKSDLLALAACMRSARAPITPAALSAITAPTLVVVGSEDNVAGPADELAQLIPGARALTLDGRDHMKAVGAREFRAAVLEFLAKHS